jgi:hypothetical protein
MSAVTPPEASLFPLPAPSIESSNPIVSFLRYYVGFPDDGCTKLPPDDAEIIEPDCRVGKTKNRKKTASPVTPERAKAEAFWRGKGRGMKEEWSDWEARHRTRRDRESRG